MFIYTRFIFAFIEIFDPAFSYGDVGTPEGQQQFQSWCQDANNAMVPVEFNQQIGLTGSSNESSDTSRLKFLDSLCKASDSDLTEAVLVCQNQNLNG